MCTVLEPGDVAERARKILYAWQADEEFAHLHAACVAHATRWCALYGYPVTGDYNAHKDAPSLFTDAIRVMALKSAVYEMTNGDEDAAELPVPVAIDAMSHALCAQFTLLWRIQDRTGFKFVRRTDTSTGDERRAWDFGDFTHQCYRAAFGPVNIRTWIGADEVERRRRALDRYYEGIGLTDLSIDFLPSR